MSDGDLVVRSLAGDGEAFAVLLRRHDEPMRRLASRLLVRQSAVDDVLQNAYLNAYRYLDRFRIDAQFRTWLYRITYNACIDELRKRQDELTPDAGVDVPSRRRDPEATVIHQETVRAALARLPFAQRATVALVDGEGCDMNTAAGLLDVAPGTVASRLSRGRAALRKVLEEDE
jgi:RNA polymerase sigma-70 factor (ECF subfamily)